VAIGAYFSAFLSKSGHVYLCGEESHLALNSDQPVLVADLPPPQERVIQIACCINAVAALTDKGNLYTWGNGTGFCGGNYLGHGDRISKEKPTLLNALKGVVRYIACGYIHMIAIDMQGQLWSWGDGDTCRLGLGFSKHFDYPVKVEPMKEFNVKKLSLSRGNEIAVTHDNKIFIWGESSFGGHFNVESPKELSCSFNYLRDVKVIDVCTGLQNTAIVVSVPMKLSTVCLRYLAFNFQHFNKHLLDQLPLDVKENMVSYLKARKMLTDKHLQLLNLQS